MSVAFILHSRENILNVSCDQPSVHEAINRIPRDLAIEFGQHDESVATERLSYCFDDTMQIIIDKAASFMYTFPPHKLCEIGLKYMTRHEINIEVSTRVFSPPMMYCLFEDSLEWIAINTFYSGRCESPRSSVVSCKTHLLNASSIVWNRVLPGDKKVALTVCGILYAKSRKKLFFFCVALLATLYFLFMRCSSNFFTKKNVSPPSHNQGGSIIKKEYKEYLQVGESSSDIDNMNMEKVNRNILTSPAHTNTLLQWKKKEQHIKDVCMRYQNRNDEYLLKADLTRETHVESMTYVLSIKDNDDNYYSVPIHSQMLFNLMAIKESSGTEDQDECANRDECVSKFIVTRDSSLTESDSIVQIIAMHKDDPYRDKKKLLSNVGCELDLPRESHVASMTYVTSIKDRSDNDWSVLFQSQMLFHFMTIKKRIGFTEDPSECANRDERISKVAATKDFSAIKSDTIVHIEATNKNGPCGGKTELFINDIETMLIVNIPSSSMCSSLPDFSSEINAGDSERMMSSALRHDIFEYSAHVMSFKKYETDNSNSRSFFDGDNDVSTMQSTLLPDEAPGGKTEMEVGSFEIASLIYREQYTVLSDASMKQEFLFGDSSEMVITREQSQELVAELESDRKDILLADMQFETKIENAYEKKNDSLCYHVAFVRINPLYIQEGRKFVNCKDGFDRNNNEAVAKVAFLARHLRIQKPMKE